MRPLLPALTGLRFVAALHVVVYHALRPVLVDAQSPVARFTAHGPDAVTLFFVLSGFVLTWVYGASDAPIPRRAYFMARVARLAPVYFLALLAVVPLGALARAHGVVQDPLGALSLVLVSTGLQAWIPSAALRWNPPAWSLSCELFFYALFPWLLGLTARAKTRSLVAFGAGAWLVGLAVPMAYLALDPDGLGAPDILDEGTWLHAVKFHPLARWPDFVIGVIAGQLHLRGVRVSARLGVFSLVVAFALPMLAPWPSLVLHNGALAPLFAVVVAWLAEGETRLAKALASSWFVRLGDASYALYLVHVPMMMWAMALLRQRTLAPDVALVVCALAIPVSLLVEKIIEKPLRAWLRVRFSR